MAGLLQQVMQQQAPQQQVPQQNRRLESGISVDQMPMKSDGQSEEMEEGDNRPDSQGEENGEQKTFHKLVLMAIEHLTNEKMFKSIASQVQAGDAGQAIATAVVQTLLAIKNAAMQAGVQINSQMLSAASVECTKQVVMMLAKAGMLKDPNAAFHDAIEYGKTLVANGQQQPQQSQPPSQIDPNEPVGDDSA